MRRESHVRFWESAGVRFPRATRLVRSIKEECLDRVIPLGDLHFRRAVTEFVAHDHRERNHQRLGQSADRGDARGRRVRPSASSFAGWADCSITTSGLRDQRVG